MNVDRRTGGLETPIPGIAADHPVDRRTGGLESFDESPL